MNASEPHSPRNRRRRRGVHMCIYTGYAGYATAKQHVAQRRKARALWLTLWQLCALPSLTWLERWLSIIGNGCSADDDNDDDQRLSANL